MDKSNRHLWELNLMLDSVTSDLHKDGVGAMCKSAPVITMEHKNLFLDSGSLGQSSPSFQNTGCFMLVSISFYGACRDNNNMILFLSSLNVTPQIPVFIRSKPITIIQSSSPNIISIAINLWNKEVHAYAQPGSPCCLVKLHTWYLSV